MFPGWKDHKEEWKKVGSDRPYHYLGSAIWFNRIGNAMGDVYDQQQAQMEHQADVVEVNHYFDARGELVFDQIIFWEWWETPGTFHVVAWRFVKHPAHIPLRDWSHGGYVIRFYDGNVLREVRAPVMWETWTQYDPEVRDRRRLPPNRRRGLWRR